MPEITEDDYSLKATPTKPIAAPDLAYLPRDPKAYRPAIGLIGCGGISAQHLNAYQKAGYNVVALCDLIEERARDRKAKYFPSADIYTDYRDLLQRGDIEVVDIATHPPERVPLIEASLKARKHVLSQKPFVLDLKVGERFVALAEENGVKLAVNQNGRWAPHFSYIRQAVRGGLLGKLMSAHLSVHWDHTWTVGTAFEDIHDLVLYDFGIHWFDIVSHLFEGRAARRVYATRTRAVDQQARPPMLAEVIIEFEGAQASLVFDAHVKYGPQDRTYVTGTDGTIISIGPGLTEQTVTLYTASGFGSPALEGSWFPGGFHGTMAELLCAIEEGREPINSARENLKSLALCFAAIASATDGEPKAPGEVHQLPEGSAPMATDLGKARG